MERKIVSSLFTVVMAVLVLAGCSNEKVSTGNSNTLKVWRSANVVDPESDPILQQLEKKLAINLQIVSVSWEKEVEILNEKMQSKENIDIIQAARNSDWISWGKDGLMYDIGKLIKGNENKYPFINSILESESFKGLAIDRKNYFLPSTHHGQDTALYIRKDWLDKLGLKIPKTEKELYEVLKAFKEEDPDGNGQDDTIGIQVTMPTQDNFSELDGIMRAFGGSFGGYFKDYAVRKGKVVPIEITDNTKVGFEFINKLYREGLINVDFMNLKNVDEGNSKYLYTNKAGVIWTSRVVEFEENIKRIDPEAKLAFVAPIEAEGYKFLKSQGSAWGGLIGIPKTCKNPEKALEFIEYVNSEEGRKLMVAGIEGKHYTSMKDGIYDRNKKAWEKDYDLKVNGYDYPLWWGFIGTVHGYIPVKEYKTFEEALANIKMYLSEEEAKKEFNWKTVIENGRQYNEPNAFHSVFIEEAMPIREKIQNEVKAVYHLAMITANSEEDVDKIWDKYVSEWKAAGGEKVINLYQQYYEKNLK